MLINDENESLQNKSLNVNQLSKAHKINGAVYKKQCCLRSIKKKKSFSIKNKIIIAIIFLIILASFTGLVFMTIYFINNGLFPKYDYNIISTNDDSKSISEQDTTNCIIDNKVDLETDTANIEAESEIQTNRITDQNATSDENKSDYYEISVDPYLVKVIVEELNIRYAPGTNYSVLDSIKNQGIYTIVSEAYNYNSKDWWGKLSSGVGWICLDYIERYDKFDFSGGLADDNKSKDDDYTFESDKIVEEHDWIEATCTEPKTCRTCGKTEGVALEHVFNWVYDQNTDSSVKKCLICGLTACSLGHHDWQWENAVPRKCRNCDIIKCEALGQHNCTDATCISPKYCRDCGKTFGESLDHTCIVGICGRCGELIHPLVKLPGVPIETSRSKWTKMRIYDLSYEFDEYCNLRIHFTFNKTWDYWGNKSDTAVGFKYKLLDEKGIAVTIGSFHKYDVVVGDNVYGSIYIPMYSANFTRQTYTLVISDDD